MATSVFLESLPLIIGDGLEPFPDRFSILFWLANYLMGWGILTLTVYCLLAWTPLLLTGRSTGALPRTERETAGKQAWWASMPSSMIILVILLDLAYILNGFSPYLGFKYFYSQAMYSNLQTDSSGSNHLFIPHLGLFENDVFVRISELEFTPPVSDEELRNNRGLQELLENKDQSLVEKNFLMAVLGNACRTSGHEVSIRMVEIRSGVPSEEQELSCVDLEKMRSRPFNFYPWFRQPETNASQSE